MKFVAQLTTEEKETLTEAYLHHPNARVRQRAHAILLNNRHYLVTQLRELFEVRHQTVSSWLDAWENYGLMGLYDDPRSGRPPILSESEQSQFFTYLQNDSLQTKAAIARLQEETGKEASIDTFKRVLKKMTQSAATATA